MKAPRSYPKSSDSSRPSLSAPQLIEMKGSLARSLCWWIARATNSLPVPDSPVIRTVRSQRAVVSICRARAFMGGEFPIMPMSFRENFDCTIVSQSSTIIRDRGQSGFDLLTLSDGRIGQKFRFERKYLLFCWVSLASRPAAKIFLVEAGISGRVSRLQKI